MWHSLAAPVADAGRSFTHFDGRFFEFVKPGFYLAVDCLTPRCRGERTFAVADLASFHGAQRTVGAVLQRMRCCGGRGGHVGAAWLVTGPILNARVRPRRVPLRGPEARE